MSNWLSIVVACVFVLLLCFFIFQGNSGAGKAVKDVNDFSKSQITCGISVSASPC